MDLEKDESKFTLVPDVNSYFLESELVSIYKESSSNYKNLLRAAVFLEDDKDVVTTVKKLENASTFKDMLDIIKPYDLEKRSLPVKLLAKPCNTFLGFFSSKANYSYYLFNLREDIISYGLRNECSISFKAK